MEKATICLNEVTKIKEFVNDVSKMDADIDVVKGRYVICATSLMGLFSLDLSEPVDVVLHSEDIDIINRFIGTMKKYEA